MMYVKALSLLSLVGALGALVSGCPVAPIGGPPCSTDADCETGRYCGGPEIGCTLDCRIDIDCTGGQTCDVMRGRCVGGADGGVPRDAAPDAPVVCRNDGDCDDGVFCNGPERCTPGAAGVPADGCAAAVSPCASGATCDEDADMCRTTCDEDSDGNGRLDADNDGDGHRSIACGPLGAVLGDDCDDADGDRYPRTLAEVCDPLAPAHDEDCSPCTVAAYGVDGDLDRDGYTSIACSNPIPADVDPTTFSCPVTVASLVHIDRDTRLVTGTDCDDGPATGRDVHPTGTEACNGVDDNCDGDIDEGVLPMWYRDTDLDGNGSAADGISTECLMPTGYSPTNDDCAPADPAIHPGARELCDAAMISEDCDASMNEDCGCIAGREMDCTAPYPGCPTAAQTCIMDPVGSHWGSCSVTPPTVTCYVDRDSDGYALEGAAASTACTCPVGTTVRPPTGSNRDCDETSVFATSVRPGVAEVCNGRDDDCNSLVVGPAGVDDVPGIPAAELCTGSGTRTCSDPACGGAAGVQDCVTCRWTGRDGAGAGVCRRTGYVCPAGSTRPCSITVGADGRYGVPTCSGLERCNSSCNFTGATCAPIGMPETCDFVDNNCNGSIDEGIGGCCGWQWTWTTYGPGGLGDDYHDCDGACSFPSSYPLLGPGFGYYSLSAPIQVAGVMNYSISSSVNASVGGFGAVISAGNRVGPDEYGVPSGPGLAVIWDQAASRLRVYQVAGSSIGLVAERACSRRTGDVAMDVFILGDNVVAGVGPVMRDRSWCEITTSVPNFMRDNLGEPRYFGSVGFGSGQVDMGNIWLTRSGFLGSAGTCDTTTYCGACF